MLMPLARMQERYVLEKAESDVSAFYCTLFKAELVTKLAACAVLAGISDDRDRNRYSIQRDLVRADGIGEWAEAMDRALTGPSAQFLKEEFKDLQRELLMRLPSETWQHKALTSLHTALGAFQVDSEKLPAVAPLRLWFKLFAQLRNKTRGHGATLPGECALALPHLEYSINLIVENLCVFKWEWAYLHRNLSGKYRITAMSDSVAKYDYLKHTKTETLLAGVYIFVGEPIRVELIESDPDITDFFVPNGQFKNSDYEVISYITNQKKRHDGSRWLAPAMQLPNSETHGGKSLDLKGGAFTNVPPPPEDYIERSSLELELDGALTLNRHEIVTLGGSGGVGKTSLALSVIKKLQEQSHPRFETIVWFSARDIDLLPSGPKSVRPHGVSLADFAREYVTLVEPKSRESKDFKPEQFFANALTGVPTGPSLYVFDNFETVINPVEVYRWLDTYIRSPNKVLITTRAREFVGDFPIEVRGMREPEAMKLIDSVSARLGIQELLNDDYRRALFDESSGHPYVIKIMLGEVSKHKRLLKPERIIATQDQILQALFERTYSSLSPAAQRVFLLLSTWRSIVPSIAIEAVAMRSAEERIDVRAAIDELKRLSFIEEIVSGKDAETFISSPLAAQAFGLKKLNASSLKAVIQADSELLKDFGAIRREGISAGVNSRVAHLIKAVARRIAAQKETIESVSPMLEFVASRVPAAWFDISQLYLEEGGVSGRRLAINALRRLIESGDDTTPRHEVWRHLAGICHQDGDLKGEMQALAELSNSPTISLTELSSIADSINRIFAIAKRDGKTLFQVDERSYLLKPIVEGLERRLKQMDATELSRLAWLYMHINDETRAKVLANKGLEMEPLNEYCNKLAQKFSRLN